MGSISSFRSILYGTAKYLGDAQAIQKAVRVGSVAPLLKRAARRTTGRATGKLLGQLFR